MGLMSCLSILNLDFKQIAQVEAGDHCIVDIEQKAQAITLLLELFLDRWSVLRCNGIVPSASCF
jgi:hypothetical protein